MYWGAGPGLGVFSVLGYIAFVTGAVLVWRNRQDFSTWVYDEIGSVRRSFSRHTVVGPFYGLREESRLRSIPACFVRSLGRIPRSTINRGAILLLIGPLLLLLDFFI